ncbi:putative membrane protein SpoIIM required for sporulation [Actinocrispum wychmicini]|uniref:Putative membrane protein SpoIIM required for sporulation n=1 Tax=Actinocrispum wychmicini TaxID=1213861 RepID=A0A4R2JTX1_9PSEU|nr:putative membrane protein SpoIIM required for sporulation [Actinocrispum wychmicini]
MFVAAHRAEWDRLGQLAQHAGRVRGPEADELVRLYQRAATHLSIVRTEAPDPALVARLSTLVARARSAITGTDSPAWREFGLFFARRLPAALYLGGRWWVPTALAFLAVSGLIAVWVATNTDVQGSIAAPEQIQQMTKPGGAYEAYYSSNPAGSFAAEVWTNNAWIAAGCLLLGVLLGVPVVFLLWGNALNLGVGIGLMTAAGRGDVFLGLLAPHGLLELTAVFVASGIGLRLGWTVIDPRGRTRAEALAAEGRSVVAVALGLVCVLAVSGAIEAFVTPSGLPTWARVGIGVLAELLFLAYVFVVGRRAARMGETGDVDARYAEDTLPTAV